MATQVADQAPEKEVSDEAAAQPKSGARIGALPIMIVVGLLAGGGLGAFATGPMLARRLAAPPAAAKKADDGAPRPLHAIDNLVLNPAGSGGTRFLMVNATLQLRDAVAEQLVKDREAEVRDRIIGLLGKKTVDELSDIGRRDAIKRQVLASVAPMFPRGTVLKVFFPQFVIQ